MIPRPSAAPRGPARSLRSLRALISGRSARSLAAALLGFVAATMAAAACTSADAPCAGNNADVVGVTTSGGGGSATFAVSIRSDETGCQCYADWWEVVGLDGSLIQRRILLHPHENEQPFTRSGDTVQLADDLYVIIRAHMHGGGSGPGGYGGAVFKGSLRDGFKAATAPEDFAPGLETQQPLPDGCAG